jgi:hypothetical protein
MRATFQAEPSRAEPIQAHLDLRRGHWSEMGMVLYRAVLL